MMIKIPKLAQTGVIRGVSELALIGEEPIKNTRIQYIIPYKKKKGKRYVHFYKLNAFGIFAREIKRCFDKKCGIINCMINGNDQLEGLK